MTEDIVELSNLRKSFELRKVLDDLTWSIKRGGVIGLVGRNGAGKSTLLQCMLGLLEIDAGSARVFGDRAAELSDSTRSRLGYVPQKSDLFGWLTADQLLAYFKAFYPHWNGEKTSALLERWRVPRDRVISKFSTGEKQRLSIIRALAHEPELLILDEPVSGLDPAGRRDFLSELMTDVVDRGTTVVFSTHILSDMQRVSADVAFLKDGRIRLHAPLDETIEYCRRLTGASNIIDAFGFEALAQTRHGDGTKSIIVKLDESQLGRVDAAGGAVRVETLLFDELFEEITR